VKKPWTQPRLLEKIKELEIRLRPGPKKKSEDPVKKRKTIIKEIKKDHFSKPYKYKWFKTHKEKDLECLFPPERGGVENFRCPQCDKSCKPTLQHTWHPIPYRVLCNREISEGVFKKLLPDYIEYLKSKPNVITKEQFDKFKRRLRRTEKISEEDCCERWPWAMASTNYALAFFSSNELLLRHLGEIRRHIELRKNDYKYICNSCAFGEDRLMIDGGKRVPGEVYFLLEDTANGTICPKREMLAQAIADCTYDCW